MLSLILSNPLIAGGMALAVLVAIGLFIRKIYNTGKIAERAIWLERERKARQHNDKIIDDAHRAGDAAAADHDSLSNDGYRRD